jgi:hypothetical protein
VLYNINVPNDIALHEIDPRSAAGDML